MALTSIGTQLTPGRPIEITFAPNTTLPSDLQTVVLIGHMQESGAGSGNATINTLVTINNSSDEAAASGECVTKFGDNTELLKMVLAAIKSNAGGSTFPQLKAIPLAAAETAFGSSDAALTALKAAANVAFAVSCYDAANPTLRNKLRDACVTMSGATRTDNNQFGTIGVAANFSVSDPSLLPATDNYNLSLVWKRDSAPARLLGETAAAACAKLGSLGIPFNPLDGVVLGSEPAPDSQADWISVGAGLESETALGKGWTPLRVKANGDVAFVRTVTTRTTVNGSTTTNAYIDVQDFQVLFYWRKTLWTRFNQTDFANVKASQQKAKDLKAEAIRLAKVFEGQNMFQAVNQLASQFVVERSLTDRSRFDLLTPVNVIPGLHVIATNINAGTQFDTFTA